MMLFVKVVIKTRVIVRCKHVTFENDVISQFIKTIKLYIIIIQLFENDVISQFIKTFDLTETLTSVFENDVISQFIKTSFDLWS